MKYFILLILLGILAVSCGDDDPVTADSGVADRGAAPDAKKPDAGAMDAARADGAGSADAATVSSGLVITTRKGKVKGKAVGKARGFFGIPFAAPPTGSNRFKAPRPVTAWSGERDATAYGPSCLQDGALSLTLPNQM